jgi:glycosyltransferase involved in cell wall biosynthesis
MSDSPKRISVIVPCFNEEAVLPQLFERLTNAAQTWGVPYEVICVDDGSRDATWNTLKQLHTRDSRWRCIAFARNFGHQTAVSAGLFYAEGDAVLIIDADLQDPPEEIVRLIDKWREGYHVVYAVRVKRQDGFMKSLLAWGFYRVLSKAVPFQIPTDSGDFCLLDRLVVNTLNAMPERNKYLRGLRAWCGFRQIGVEFQRQARAAGEPQYTFSKSLGLALDGIFSFSALPLRFASYLGLWVSLLALAGVIFTFCQRVFRNYFSSIGLGPAPGFATIVISILFLGGVQLICLGILGEYLGRIYDEVKGRPLWIIRESAGLKTNPIPVVSKN